MPTALIADDEPNLADELKFRLERLWPALQVLAVAPNGIAALTQINARRPDFAFLDIRMPGLDGLQVARAARDTRVIFVTAYDEYALSAFDAAALDYLLKPVDDARLARCISRLQEPARALSDVTAVGAIIARDPPTEAPLQWLTVGLAQTTRLVSIDEVLYFQASDKYTEVVTAHGRHLIRTPLKDLLARLDARRFMQIHRGAIVAVAAIDRLERDLLGRLSVHLKGRSEVLPVSRGFAAQFKQM
ncbi:MAG: LytR/AlgR family response regulator transcription factor [Janthinobacterium lividum]